MEMDCQFLRGGVMMTEENDLLTLLNDCPHHFGRGLHLGMRSAVLTKPLDFLNVVIDDFAVGQIWISNFLRESIGFRIEMAPPHMKAWVVGYLAH